MSGTTISRCSSPRFLSGSARAQARALPLENLGLEHLDIVVPDTAESARFYKRVFSSPLHEQEFRGGKREIGCREN